MHNSHALAAPGYELHPSRSQAPLLFDHDVSLALEQEYQWLPGKITNKIDIPKAFFFLPGILEILFVSAILDHIGGISRAGLSSGHLKAFTRTFKSGHILSPFTEWDDARKRENVPFVEVNSGDNVIIECSRAADPRVSMPVQTVAALRAVIESCSPKRAPDSSRALQESKTGIIKAIESIFVDYVIQAQLNEQAQEHAQIMAHREFTQLTEVSDASFDEFVRLAGIQSGRTQMTTRGTFASSGVLGSRISTTP
ncbi:hypothetical protein LTR17_021700 [Elasticomyces elasticus]|nr:hypothetical protein LTR17_021700 [Elasticomyces elasticus]